MKIKRMMSRLLCGLFCAAMVAPTLPPMPAAAAGDSWKLVGNWSFSVKQGSPFAQSKTFSVSLPEGLDKTEFRLHLSVSVTAAAAEMLNADGQVELDNETKCDTSEITWSVRGMWKEGDNDILLPFASGSNGRSVKYDGPDFSVEKPIRFFRIYSNQKASEAAKITFTSIAIELTDGGIAFGSDGRDTYLSTSKPITKTPDTVEATVTLSPDGDGLPVCGMSSADRLTSVYYSNGVAYRTNETDDGPGKGASYAEITVAAGNKFGFDVTGKTIPIPASVTSADDLTLSFWLLMEEGSDTFTTGQLELTSSGTCDKNEINWDPKSFGLKAGWNHIVLPLGKATVLHQDQPLNVRSINYLRWHTTTIASGKSAKVGVANIRLIASPAAEEDARSVILEGEGISLSVNEKGQPSFVWGDRTVAADTDLRTGKPIRLALVREKAAGVLSLFADGKKIAEEKAGGTEAPVPGVMTVGADRNGKHNFIGTVADLRLWETARTAKEMEASAGRFSLDGTEKGLIAAWSLKGNVTNILDILPDLKGENPIVFCGSKRNEWFDYEIPEEIGSDYHTLVWIPDPQNITTASGQQKWEDDTDWIAANLEKEHVFHVISAGDNTWGNDEPTWKKVQNGYAKFWNDVSWSSLVGNHDFDWNVKCRDTRFYNQYLGLEQIENTAAYTTFGGWYEEDDAPYVTHPAGVENSYYFFTIGSAKWMLLQLEYHTRPSVMEWANGILDKYSDRHVILATHGLIGNNNGDYISWVQNYMEDEKAAGDFTENMKSLYTNVVKKHGNVCLVLSGHTNNPNGYAVMAHNEKRPDGSVVYQLMINAQYMDASDKGEFTYYDNQAVGMLALLRFSSDGSKVAVNYFCPSDGKSYEPIPDGGEPSASRGSDVNLMSNFVLDFGFGKKEEPLPETAPGTVPETSGQTEKEEEKEPKPFPVLPTVIGGAAVLAAGAAAVLLAGKKKRRS
ncbi:MAG: hypothetical protein MJ070_00425 [Lachnospiraceae bacterium]|nr:hypothetical protein [Lachnospiraceae bacterium]